MAGDDFLLDTISKIKSIRQECSSNEALDLVSKSELLESLINGEWKAFILPISVHQLLLDVLDDALSLLNLIYKSGPRESWPIQESDSTALNSVANSLCEAAFIVDDALRQPSPDEARRIRQIFLGLDGAGLRNLASKSRPTHLNGDIPSSSGKCAEITEVPPSPKTVSLSSRPIKESISRSPNNCREGSLSPAQLPLLVPQAVNLERLIGHGTNGKVHSGLYQNKRVAVKILEDPKGLKPAEEKAMVQLSRDPHPNVVQTIGKYNNTCVVMERMERDLHSLIEDQMKENNGRRPPFPWYEITDILLQIAHGMECLHQQGVAHRDLKPKNIMINPGARNIVKIVDFGTARTDFDSYGSLRTHPVGTTPYMAPELQERDKSQNSNYAKVVDVYSFGVTAIHLIKGKISRQNVGHWETILRESGSSIPETLATVILKCVSSDASERPLFSEVCKGLVDVKKYLLRKDVEENDRKVMDEVHARHQVSFIHKVCKLVVNLPPGRYHYRWRRGETTVQSGVGLQVPEYLLNADDIYSEVSLVFGHGGSEQTVNFGVMKPSDRMQRLVDKYWRKGRAVFYTEKLGEQLVITKQEVILQRLFVVRYRTPLLPQSSWTRDGGSSLELGNNKRIRFMTPFISDLAAWTLKRFASSVPQ